MKTKFTMTLTLFMALIVQLTFAQQKTVSGTVSDENGLPLIGATVIVAGTSSGTTTDFDGNYKINTNTGDVLNFSYVGYSDQNITVGASNTMNATLQPDNTLDEVVVTALGIKRDKKALGYAQQGVGGDDNMVFAATHGRGVFSGNFTAQSLNVFENAFASSNLKVFPTVSSGIINIISKEHIEKVKFNIYDMTGKKVYSDILNLYYRNTPIDISNLKSGFYILRFSKDNTNYTHKIVIR